MKSLTGFKQQDKARLNVALNPQNLNGFTLGERRERAIFRRLKRLLGNTKVT